jgi:chromatin structure-remodeling complex subunit RSC1/2
VLQCILYTSKLPSDEEDEDAAAADDDEDEYNEKGVKIDSSATRSTRTRTCRTASLRLDSADGDEKKDDTARPEDDTPKPENEVPRKRKRGRPPKIDTPEEARIRSILRTVWKIKDTDGRQFFLEFEKLPDQELYPDYYKEIKRPVALDFITVWTLFQSILTGAEKDQETRL